MHAHPLLTHAMQPHTAQLPATQLPTAQSQTMQAMQAMQTAQPAPRYDPDHLLATLIERLNLKNDAALSRALEVSPPVISKIRHRRLPVTASLLIRMHEVSALSIKELRLLMGDRRQKFRISDKHFKPKSAS
jgi:plasmid maintenance system antidote protein VapI